MRARSVVVLNDFCYVQGGASRVAIDEAVALRALGLDVTFLGAVGPVCPELSAAGVRTICLQQPELLDARRHPGVLLQALWNQNAYRAARSLFASLDRRQAVAHLHGYTKALTASPALAARRVGFPIVCTLHDFFAACPNGAFFDYRWRQPCRLRALSSACVMSNCDKRHPAHKAYRLTRSVAQRLIAGFPASVRDYVTLSARSANLLRPYLPADARFYPLANVIDVPQRPPVDVGANDLIVVVGRLDVEKGVGLAAEAARRIGQSITFVGDGPLRAELDTGGACVTGWLSTTGVRDVLERTRCLLFPSLWYETYGLVVDEAAARGIPAIVSEISAPADRVEDGVSGWVFRSGDLASLQNCILQTRDDAVVRAAGAASYRRYWANPLEPRRHAHGLLAIYDEVIARGGFA